MITWDATQQAAAAASVRGSCWLVSWDFSSGLLRTTTWPTNVTATDATVWTRLGNNLEVGPIRESTDGNTAKLDLKLAVQDATWFAYAIGDPTVYRNRAVRCHLQLMTEAMVPWGAYTLRIVAMMDSIEIERDQPRREGGSIAGRIIVHCSKPGFSRMRRKEGLRLTDASHQVRYPGDTGYKYVASLLEKPALWLSKRFQELK